MRIFDLHNDVLVESPKDAQAILRRQCAVLAVWTTRLGNPTQVFDRARVLTDYWAIEDLGFCGDLSIFDVYKPLYVSLTWNDENRYAFGALADCVLHGCSQTGGGLKPDGKAAIEKLESCGVILDTAHLNQKSFFEAAEIAKKPFICSHTCFNGVFSHKRNLDDRQISLIIESGGIVGLTFVSEFMGVSRATVKDVIKQIEHYSSRFPIENLSIGSDFFGTKSPAIKNYNGFSGLKNELLKLNYTECQINKIFYQNAYDFFTEEQNGRSNL